LLLITKKLLDSVENVKYKQKVASQITDDVFIPEWEKQIIIQKEAKKIAKEKFSKANNKTEKTT
jgi:hypothetical protein